MSIVVESPGLFDTLQDAGRPGHRSFGVPLGGWFDADSAAYANALVGNDSLAPCLEVTLRSGLFRALKALRIGFAGPGAIVTIYRATGASFTFPESIAADLEPGDTFRVHHPARGLRSYVAAAGGGWLGEAVLGSVSSESRLAAGQVLDVRDLQAGRTGPSARKRLGFDLAEAIHFSDELAFVPGSEFGALTHSAADFGQTGWKMSDRSNRVGVRFTASPEVANGLRPIDQTRLSEPVVPGSMQWTGSELIVLGVAGGTMGGYPVFGHLVPTEIFRLAQLRPGAAVRFRAVTLAEAAAMLESHERKRSRYLTFVRLSGHPRSTGQADFASD